LKGSFAGGDVAKVIERSAGRSTFGGDPEKYDWARHAYPDAIYQALREICGLKPGARTFEVGPGTGIATRELLALGAAPLVAIEPDARLASYLESVSPGVTGKLRVMNAAFEDADLPDASFDLGVSATAFHWLDQGPALAKAHRLLRPGGWWAMWWNHYGDPMNHTEFDRATEHLFAGTPGSPSQGAKGKPPFAFDADGRIADLQAAGFIDVQRMTMRSTFTFETARFVALHSTFSVVLHLSADRRSALLSELARIIDTDFGGKVERALVTPLYMARRR
jgi:SAM-dependent methyltransferase